MDPGIAAGVADQKLGAAQGCGSPQAELERTLSFKGITMNGFEKILSEVQQINGILCSAFVDANSGMVMAQAGTGLDVELAAAGNTEVMRAKLRTIELLKLDDDINDVLVTTATQYHLLYPCKAVKDVFIYAVFNRASANLALIRRQLADIEANLVSLLFGDQSAALHGLNVKAALDAHCAWRDRLRGAIMGDATKGAVSAETAASDSACVLGEWLHDTGKKMFADRAEYQQLMKTHADFHRCAGHVLHTLSSQGQGQAKAELDNDFQKSSVVVQKDLVRFFTSAASKQ